MLQVKEKINGYAISFGKGDHLFPMVQNKVMIRLTLMFHSDSRSPIFALVCKQKLKLMYIQL